uniref:PAS domain S-box protein n=1 Tax=candidate division WOR-3 bacterium TaxID=2052148 RepID=A0A7V0Z668_UNCW3
MIESFSEKIIRGKNFKFHTIKVPLRNEKGEVWGLCGIARDITEYETIKQDLIKSHDRLQLISNNIVEAIFILDMDLKFTFVTPSIKILGYEIEELLENGIEKILTAQSYVDAMKVLREELEIEKSHKLDKERARVLTLQIRKKNRSILWAEITFKFLRDGEGKPNGILGVARDVTETYETHQKLNRSYRQLDRLLEGVVNALASAVEKRDPYTAGHQRRVAELAVAITKELGVSEEIIDYLRIAALLHDVG